jgi:hypothetical protein
MIKTVIVTMCTCILFVGTFIGGVVVSSYFVTIPMITVIENVLDTSSYTEGDMLVLIKDSKGVILRKCSLDELIKLTDGLR